MEGTHELTKQIKKTNDLNLIPPLNVLFVQRSLLLVCAEVEVERHLVVRAYVTLVKHDETAPHMEAYV